MSSSNCTHSIRMYATCIAIISVHTLPLNRISVLVHMITFGDSNTHTHICAHGTRTDQTRPSVWLTGKLCVAMHFQFSQRIVRKRNKSVNVSEHTACVCVCSISANLILNKCFRTNRVKMCACIFLLFHVIVFISFKLITITSACLSCDVKANGKRRTSKRERERDYSNFLYCGGYSRYNTRRLLIILILSLRVSQLIV